MVSRSRWSIRQINEFVRKVDKKINIQIKKEFRERQEPYWIVKLGALQVLHGRLTSCY